MVSILTKFRQLSLLNKVSVCGTCVGIVGTMVTVFSSSTATSNNSIYQQGGGSGPQIGSITGNVTFNTPEEQKAEPVEIPGKWSSEKAQSIAMEFFKKEDKNFAQKPCVGEVSKSCQATYEFLGEYNLRYRSKQVMILAYAYHTLDNDCHACDVPLSFFEFEKLPAGWKLVEANYNPFTWGTWGRMFPEQVKVHVIGDDLYGIVFEGGYMAQGIVTTGTSIYTKIGDSFKEIFFLETGYDDTSYYAERGAQTVWTSEIIFQPVPTGFYDLSVQRKGMKNREPFQERESFKFDGQKYVSSQWYK